MLDASFAEDLAVFLEGLIEMSDEENADWEKPGSSDCCAAAAAVASSANAAATAAAAAIGAPATRGDEFIVEILSKLSQMTAPSTDSATGTAAPPLLLQPHGAAGQGCADSALAAVPECFEDYCYYDSCGSGSFVPYSSNRDAHRGSDVHANFECGRGQGQGQWEATRASTDGAQAAVASTAPATAASPRFAPPCSRAVLEDERVLQREPALWAVTTATRAVDAGVRTQTASAAYEAATDKDAFAMLASRVRRGGNQTHLWEFLLELLTDAATYSSVIGWENEEGTFCIRNPAELAAIWGQRRKRQNMTYEKLSRSLRHYYDKKILRKVPKRKYTYKFNCREILRTYDVPPAFRYHHQFRKRAAAVTSAAAAAAADSPAAAVPRGSSVPLAAAGGTVPLLQYQQTTSLSRSPPSPSPLLALCASMTSPTTESMDSADSETDASMGAEALGGLHQSPSAAWHQRCDPALVAAGGVRYRQLGVWSGTEGEGSPSPPPPPQFSSPPAPQQQGNCAASCGIGGTATYGYGQQLVNRWQMMQLEGSTEAAVRLRHDSGRIAAVLQQQQQQQLGVWRAAAPAASLSVAPFSFDTGAASAWVAPSVPSCSLAAQATSAQTDGSFDDEDDESVSALAASCGAVLEARRSGADEQLSPLRPPPAPIVSSPSATMGLYGAVWDTASGLSHHQPRTALLQQPPLLQQQQPPPPPRPLAVAFSTATAASQLVGRPHSAPEPFNPPDRTSAERGWDGNHSAPGYIGRWFYPPGATGLDYQ